MSTDKVLKSLRYNDSDAARCAEWFRSHAFAKIYTHIVSKPITNIANGTQRVIYQGQHPQVGSNHTEVCRGPGESAITVLTHTYLLQVGDEDFISNDSSSSMHLRA